MLVKRSGMPAALHFYLFTVWGKRLPTAPASVSWEIEADDRGWMPSFYFHKGAELIEADRTEELKRLTEDIFRCHLGGLIAACRRVFSISKHILWENIAVYLYWMYDTLLEDPKLKARAAQDFHFLLYEAEPGLFEEGADENPPQKVLSRTACGGPDTDDLLSVLCNRQKRCQMQDMPEK